MMLQKIISGGQTGADRGGLDAALVCGIPHGGWCPKGRKAEDGVIPVRYRLQETEEADYRSRTERNVREADCTLVFTFGDPSGGTRETVEFLEIHRKPFLLVDLAQTTDAESAECIADWLDAFPGPLTLNVAGPRESMHPGIALRVRNMMTQILDRS